MSAHDPALTTQTISQPKHYHPVLVTLHWLIAILLFSAALLKPEEGRFSPEGGGGFSPPGNFAPPMPSFAIHLTLGVIILVLMITRLLIRFKAPRPAWASTGNKLFDQVGELTHLGLYVLIFSILFAGGMMAYREGSLAQVLGVATKTATQGFGSGESIFRSLHELSWKLLLGLLVLHVGAALYHQFIVKDNLLGRMWFGKKTG